VSVEQERKVGNTTAKGLQMTKQAKRTVEAVADEMFRMWNSQPADYDADKASDDLGELMDRLGLDCLGADQSLVQDAYLLSMKKMFAKSFRTTAAVRAIYAKPTGKRR
jgi:hypothetical protein